MTPRELVTRCPGIERLLEAAVERAAAGGTVTESEVREVLGLRPAATGRGWRPITPAERETARVAGWDA